MEIFEVGVTEAEGGMSGAMPLGLLPGFGRVSRNKTRGAARGQTARCPPSSCPRSILVVG
jgi:hypothetical protein